MVLEGLEVVCKCLGMYIGSIDIKGFYYLVWEVIDNFIDEYLVGYCNCIEMIIYKDNFIIVKDDGWGILVDMYIKLKKLVLEVVMMVLYVGGKFDKDIYKVFGGLYGVGVFCVNVLFMDFCVEVYCDGKVYEQYYKKGKLQGDVVEIGIID